MMNDNASKAFKVFCTCEQQLSILEPGDLSAWLLDSHISIKDSTPEFGFCHGHWSELTSKFAPEQYEPVIVKQVIRLEDAIVSGDIKQSLEEARSVMAYLWEFEHCFTEPTYYPILGTKLARVVRYLRRRNY